MECGQYKHTALVDGYYVHKMAKILLLSLEMTELGQFNATFQHKYGYIRDKKSGVKSYPYTVTEGQ